MLWLVEKTDICNYADNKTILNYSCAKSVKDVLENLQSDLKIALKRFKDNQMIANLGKFQFIILSKNSFILSQFNYYCFVWMLCSKTLQNKINPKRALHKVYNKPNLNLDKLVELDKSTTFHIKKMITPLTEVYKTTSGDNPIFINKIFTPKK